MLLLFYADWFGHEFWIQKMKIFLLLFIIAGGVWIEAQQVTISDGTRLFIDDGQYGTRMEKGLNDGDCDAKQIKMMMIHRTCNDNDDKAR